MALLDKFADKLSTEYRSDREGYSWRIPFHDGKVIVYDKDYELGVVVATEEETFAGGHGDVYVRKDFVNGVIFSQEVFGRHYPFEDAKKYLKYRDEGDFYVFEDVDIYYSLDFENEEIEFFSIGEPDLPD
ncbi:MAG: hypothetical protein QXV17_14445 [Candidatus Micrarchaeaceae archaeon]